MKVKQLYIGHFITLLCGSIIYVLFRSSSLRMFGWFEKLGVLNFIKTIRSFTIDYASNLSSLILFSFPDGLWLFSYVSLILYLWKNEIRYENVFWILIVPIIAIISELGQILKIVPGTFDIIDLLMYLLGTTLPFLIYKKSITINLLNQ
ncbi:hypothetical protein SAMN04487979_103116 [Flavobacterium sp. ov086]|nr:hypothetical protein SAMN04487979_103116 [Flavobacterium sp. ov086]